MLANLLVEKCKYVIYIKSYTKRSESPTQTYNGPPLTEPNQCAYLAIKTAFLQFSSLMTCTYHLHRLELGAEVNVDSCTSPPTRSRAALAFLSHTQIASVCHEGKLAPHFLPTHLPSHLAKLPQHSCKKKLSRTLVKVFKHRNTIKGYRTQKLTHANGTVTRYRSADFYLKAVANNFTS